MKFVINSCYLPLLDYQSMKPDSPFTSDKKLYGNARVRHISLSDSETPVMKMIN